MEEEPQIAVLIMENALRREQAAQRISTSTFGLHLVIALPVSTIMLSTQDIWQYHSDEQSPCFCSRKAIRYCLNIGGQ